MTSNKHTFSLIIPVKNEVIDELKFSEYFKLVDEIIFVVKTDHELQINLPKEKSKIIFQNNFNGKGSAIILGLLSTTKQYSILLDADLPISSSEMMSHINFIESNPQFDLLKGSRNIKGGGSSDFTLLRKFGAKFFAKWTSILFQNNWTEVCYGYWIIKNSNLKLLDLGNILSYKKSFYPFESIPYGHSFEFDQVLMLRLFKNKCKIIELPSFENSRINGKSNLKVFRDGLKTLCVILFEKFFYTNNK